MQYNHCNRVDVSSGLYLGVTITSDGRRIRRTAQVDREIVLDHVMSDHGHNLETLAAGTIESLKAELKERAAA